MTYQYTATADLQFFIIMQYDSALINIPMWSWNVPSLNEIKVAITKISSNYLSFTTFHGYSLNICNSRVIHSKKFGRIVFEISAFEKFLLAIAISLCIKITCAILIMRSTALFLVGGPCACIEGQSWVFRDC